MTEINPSLPPVYADQLAELHTPEQADAIALAAAAENTPAPTEEPKSYLELPGHDLLIPLEKLKTSDSFRLYGAFSVVLEHDTQSAQMFALADFLDENASKFISAERLADWENFAVAKNNNEVLDLLMAYFAEMGND
ncbi:hypothetical protein [uncultured Rothia sp.]|uniref:hypothetical protein n=1 Tax=uncultured Rothia sp. TaxID=316088 RepID=UPI002889C1B6|nr:hypothetical protein [uncultured Rothia sp.]